MSDESKTLALHDGRQIGYGEWGAPEGRAAFFFHGTPGSRLLTRPFDKAAKERDIRLIGLDRPGYGLSSFHEGRTLLDYPNDVVQVADLLGIDRFAVMGASGGGPYVFACAHSLRDRVSGGLAISSIGPTEAMEEATRLALEAAAQHPELTEQQLAAFPEMARTDRAGLIKNLQAAVQEDFRSVAQENTEPLEAFIDHHIEGQRSGAQGTIHDQQLFLQPWGFDLESIKVPIQIWVGGNEQLLSDARYLAEKVPNSELTIREGAGHIEGLWLTDELLDLLKTLAPVT